MKHCVSCLIYYFTYTTPLNFTRFKGIIKALIQWNVCAAHVNTFSSNLVTFFRINNKMFVCPVPKISHPCAKSLVKPGFTRVQAFTRVQDFTECAKSLVSQGIPGKPGYP